MKFNAGDVITRTFRIAAQNAVTFLLLAVMLIGIPTLVSTLISHPAQLFMLAGQGPLGIGVIIVVTILAGVCGDIFQGAVVHATMSDIRGSKAGFGESLSIGFRHVLPVVAIAILASLGMMVGFLLLIIPGIILMLMWAVVIPVRVEENTSIGATFTRSRELTKGHRWWILLIALVGIALAIGIQFVLGLFSGQPVLSDPGSVTSSVAIISAIGSAVTSTFLAIGFTSLYHELRKVKEGSGAAEAAAVFE